MGRDLTSSTLRLRQSNDALAAKQALQRARAVNRQSVGRLDMALGRAECIRAIDTLLPRLLAAVSDRTLRSETDLLLGALREHLR